MGYALDRASYNQGKNAQFDISITDDGTAQTVVAKGPGAVASFYPQMKAESQCFRDDDISNTLVNGTNPGYQNGIVEPIYTVRRLTPVECCRLQGFPDYWCDDLETENPTEEEISQWTEIFETHRKALGKWLLTEQYVTRDSKAAFMTAGALLYFRNLWFLKTNACKCLQMVI